MTELLELFEEVARNPANYLTNTHHYQSEVQRLVSSYHENKQHTLGQLASALADEYPYLAQDLELIEHGHKLRQQFIEALTLSEGLPKKEESNTNAPSSPMPEIFSVETAKLLEAKASLFDRLIQLSNTMRTLGAKASTSNMSTSIGTHTHTDTPPVGDQPGSAQAYLKKHGHGQKKSGTKTPSG